MANYSILELEKDYYLGNYQECIKRANSMAGKEPIFYRCLSYFHLKKYDMLQHELRQSDEECINLIGQLLNLTEDPNRRDEVLAYLSRNSTKDDLSKFVASSIYTSLCMYQEALRELHLLESSSASLARIGIYLLMNRIDLAENALEAMKNKDDYSTFTLFASAQVCLASGNPKEAYNNAKELEDIYKATSILKNIQTVAKISLGDYHSAKEHCKSSLDLDNGNQEALINMIHIMSKLGSTDVRERHYERLKALYPDHDYVREIESINEL